MHMAQLDAGFGYRACVAVIAGPDFPAADWVSVHDAAPLITELS
jgi:hypothetical protein